LDANGVEELTDLDFIWNARTSPCKKVILAGVNRIRRENRKCGTVNTGSVYISVDLRALQSGSPEHGQLLPRAGPGVSEHPNGRTAVTSTLKTKNSLNLGLKYNVRYFLDSKGFIECSITEALR
jgi:hypothetical protein